MQVVLIGGVVALIFVITLLAELATVSCVRRIGNIVSDIACGELQARPTYAAPTDDSFFSTVGNIFTFAAQSATWFFNAASSGVGIDATIMAGLGLILVAIVLYIILKLISLGGG